MLTGLHALKLDRKKFVRNVRSDGRLKKYESISDERAWTLDKYERQHYIRDYIAAPYGSSRTGQNENCQDKLPLYMLLGALLSAKNQSLDDLKDQIEQLNDALATCKKDLDICSNGKPNADEHVTSIEDYDSKIIYRKSISKEETRTIETEDGILTDTNIDYTLETREMPAQDNEYENYDIRKSLSQEETGTETEDEILTNANNDSPLEENDMDSQECSDSDVSYDCNDLEEENLKDVCECEHDEIKVYIKMCDADGKGAAKEAFIGSLRIPKSVGAGTQQKASSDTRQGNQMRPNSTFRSSRLLDDPCQDPCRSYSMRNRSRSSGSRPSSTKDCVKQHEMIKNLNYYGECQEYPSTTYTRQSSFDQSCSQFEEEYLPSTTDENFQDPCNEPINGPANIYGNYFNPCESISSQQSFSTTAKTVPNYPCTKQRRRVSKRKYTSKRTNSQPHNLHSYNLCKEKLRPKTNSEVNPLYIERTTKRRKEVEEIGIKDKDDTGMLYPEMGITKKTSQATQTDLSCSEIGQPGMRKDNNTKSMRDIDESQQYPYQNNARSETSQSFISEIDDPCMHSRRKKINQNEIRPQNAYHHSTPRTSNVMRNNGLRVQRTSYPTSYTADSRSNSLTDLQSDINKQIQPTTRNLYSEREDVHSTPKYDPCDEQYPTSRRIRQRLSSAGGQYNYYPQTSACNKSTHPISPIKPQYKMSTSRAACQSRALPTRDYSQQYLPPNSGYPPHFFQQNISYMYP